MNSSEQTRLAIVGTISDLHTRPIAYDLSCLRKLVADVSPDLLCVEITVEDWEQSHVSRLPVEVRDALIPVVDATDIVLIPVAPSSAHYTDFGPPFGWRHKLVRSFDRLLRWGQIQANDAITMNGRWFGAFCHTLCWLTERLWTAQDRAAWENQNQLLVENIVRAVQRDSGRRVLVAVGCQRLHRVKLLLRHHSELFQMVLYQSL